MAKPIALRLDDLRARNGEIVDDATVTFAVSSWLGVSIQRTAESLGDGNYVAHVTRWLVPPVTTYTVEASIGPDTWLRSTCRFRSAPSLLHWLRAALGMERVDEWRSR